jgi:hypothetical protein
MTKPWFPSLLVALSAVALAQPALLACPVCFQVDDSATAHGIRAAVIVLFAVTTGVLSVCGVFVARFAARERQQTETFEIKNSEFRIQN